MQCLEGLIYRFEVHLVRIKLIIEKQKDGHSS